MTAVLALDLSLASTGVCSASGRLSTITPTSRGDDRLNEIVGQVLVAAGDCGADQPWVDLVVIEDVPPVRAHAIADLGMLHGAVRYQLNELFIPYLLVTPAQLKIYATGRGTGVSKADMRVELMKRTRQQLHAIYGEDGLDLRNEDECDAWWLRTLALDLCGEPILTLPQAHRRALDKLTLPEGVLGA